MLRKLKTDEKANVDMILTAVVAGVMFAIAIPIVFNIMGSIGSSTLDSGLNINSPAGNGTALTGVTPAANASDNIVTNLETFFSIGPIYIVVVAAVGIIAAILLLRGR